MEFETLRSIMMRRRNADTSDTNDQLVDYLRRRGTLESDRVELAFRSVDRALFLPEDMHFTVYVDRPIGKVIGSGGAKIHHSAPHMYASCLEQLDVQSGQSVLNLGSGTGYLSTLLAFLVGPEGVVHGVEVYPELVHHAERCLNEFNDTPLQEDAAVEVQAEAEEGQPPQENEPKQAVAQDEDLAYHTVHESIPRLRCSVETAPCPSGTPAGVQPMQAGTFLRPPSYLAMVCAQPSPGVSTSALEGWAMREYLGFAPPTPLQMAQRCLAFAVSQLCDQHILMPQDAATHMEASLPIDIIDSIGELLRSMKFPRVCAEVTFTAGNALSLDSRTSPASRYDRIYVAAQGERKELERLRGLLKPGGILVGPFEDELVKVSRGLGAHSQLKVCSS
jgi:protein-L-isoaspartate(D-aspartate) O-methyltransferase